MGGSTYSLRTEREELGDEVRATPAAAGCDAQTQGDKGAPTWVPNESVSHVVQPERVVPDRVSTRSANALGRAGARPPVPMPREEPAYFGYESPTISSRATRSSRS